MERKHLVITCTLIVNNQEISLNALIDCRATGIAFMNQDFARRHQIPLQELKEMTHFKVIDRRPIVSGDIAHNAKLGMQIQDHGEHLPMLVTKLGHYPIGLGFLSLWLQDVALGVTSPTVTFGS